MGNNKAGKPSWWLYGDNNEQVAWAGEAFYDLSNATRAAQNFKDGAALASYEVYLDDGGSEYRWRAIRGGNNVASSGEGFPTRSNAERAAANVRDNAWSATGP
ncbi:hypothetical protein [Microbacterium phyllosphaerae]|uniref:hypothetical protein n=1 Tax=Microbacterium phyllosphaerae TaxID=124798 RepID=UPI00216A61D5|nr:hypothetical protein [Microbacterium phyllosphaerae]MCS3442207.1 uncharacterized protein YegP (UPF0339 family) [Microbacterium phyllosphaerae]